jgi:hypothetical protein
MAERGLAAADPPLPTAVGLPLVAGSEPPVVLDVDPSIVISSAAPERCPSGLRSTLGKRVCPKGTGGSNPPLSASGSTDEG